MHIENVNDFGSREWRGSACEKRFGITLSLAAPFAAIVHLTTNVDVLLPLTSFESWGTRVHGMEARPSWSESSHAGDVDAELL